jgi:phosphate uptake regulator
LVEALGDECVGIASKAVELKGANLSRDLKRIFVDFHTVCFEAHENAVKAFLVGDIVLAEDVRKAREKVEIALTEIEKTAKEQTLDAVPHVLAVASLLKQIYEHSVDIADLVMPKKE